jgi:hypothetical protein
MAAKPRWVFWARGTLLSALCGHWIANAILDAGQYTRAGLEYTWRASLPILVQTILVLLIVIVLGPLADRGRRAEVLQPVVRPRRTSLLSLLATSQVALFLLLEVSERLIQREPFSGGLLASGFGFELLFAIGSALLLAGLGSVALRVIRSFRRQLTAVTVEDPVVLFPLHVAPAHPPILVGGVRAPPLVPA